MKQQDTENEKVKKLLTIDKKLLSEIEEFRFAHRCKSEAQAIRQLIRAGLESLEPNQTTINALNEPKSEYRQVKNIRKLWDELEDD